MAPKPQHIGVPKCEELPVSAVKAQDDNEDKEIIREEFFSNWGVDNTLGVSHHIFNRYWLGAAHIFGIYHTGLIISGDAPLTLILFDLVYGYLGGLGITVGCHRFWTHKSFKATVPLQWGLMVLQTIGNQYPIYKWCLDHRIHHKYTDTNADPHNSKRGFWFSHVGWLVLSRHPDFQKKLKTFDMSDLESDAIVRFQSKYYLTLMIVFNFLIPISIIYYFWQLPLILCIASNYRRYLFLLHFTWSVNSVAHLWGDKPYDKNISSVDNPIVSLLAVGEGWHNYHHTFPWDYKASEFGWKFNLSNIFIDLCAWMGLAYDLKTVSQRMLRDRLNRTGAGSHVYAKPYEKVSKSDEDTSMPDVTELMKSMEQPLWGWDDERIPEDFRKFTKVLRPERCS